MPGEAFINPGGFFSVIMLQANFLLFFHCLLVDVRELMKSRRGYLIYFFTDKFCGAVSKKIPCLFVYIIESKILVKGENRDDKTVNNIINLRHGVIG